MDLLILRRFALLTASTLALACKTIPETRRSALEPCLGDSIEMRVSSRMPYVKLQVGTTAAPVSGWFVIDTGADGSFLDIHGPSQPEMFDFFGLWKTPEFGRQDYSHIRADVRQMGLIGTDFLSLNPYTLDYTQRRLFRAPPSAFCSDAALSGAGLAAVDTRGYYSNTASQLRPGSELQPLGRARFEHVPNIPTIPIRIGLVEARAQVDSGFDDSQWPFSLNINLPLKDRLEAAGIALTPIPERDTSLSTCVVGVTEQLKAYKLSMGSRLAIVGEKVADVRTYLRRECLPQDHAPGSLLLRGHLGLGRARGTIGRLVPERGGPRGVRSRVSGRLWLPAESP